MKFRTTISGQSFEIEVDHDQLVRIDGQPLYVEMEQVGGLPLYALRIDDQAYLLFVDKDREQYQVEVRGQLYSVDVEPGLPHLAPRQAESPEGKNGRLHVTAPLAGRLLSVPVIAGQRVEANQVVAVVESMKMQMELKAPIAAVVDGVHASPGTDVAQGAELVTLRS